MLLKELLKGMEFTCLQGGLEREITALVYDSRKVEQGCAFVCLKGAKFDGHTFAAQAAGNGAAALIIEDAAALEQVRGAKDLEGSDFN